MGVYMYMWVSWKFSRVPEYTHAYFSPNFLRAFVPIDPMNVRTKFEVRSVTHSWDNSDWIFGWGLREPQYCEEEAVGGRDGTIRKSVGEFL